MECSSKNHQTILHVKVGSGSLMYSSLPHKSSIFSELLGETHMPPFLF